MTDDEVNALQGIMTAHLADPQHKLPVPNAGGRLFSIEAEGEQINIDDAFWRGLVRDGSLVLGERSASTESKALVPAIQPKPPAPAATD